MCVFTRVFDALFIQKHSQELQRLVQIQKVYKKVIQIQKSVGN